MSNHSKYPVGAGIYKLTCNNNGKIYIGKSHNMRKRLSEHKSSSKKSTGKCYIQHALIKYGWESFTVEILETFENFDKLKDNDSLLQKESYYIELFHSTDVDKGYNICKFSTDRTGVCDRDDFPRKPRTPMTEETKEKLRQYRTGKTLSNEAKEKVSRARRGKPGNPHSEEHKEKIRQSRLGKSHSKETKEKMRQAKLGKKNNKKE